MSYTTREGCFRCGDLWREAWTNRGCVSVSHQSVSAAAHVRPCSLASAAQTTCSHNTRTEAASCAQGPSKTCEAFLGDWTSGSGEWMLSEGLCCVGAE